MTWIKGHPPKEVRKCFVRYTDGSHSTYYQTLADAKGNKNVIVCDSIITHWLPIMPIPKLSSDMSTIRDIERVVGEELDAAKVAIMRTVREKKQMETPQVSATPFMDAWNRAGDKSMKTALFNGLNEIRQRIAALHGEIAEIKKAVEVLQSR